jgi:hypothetical protein
VAESEPSADIAFSSLKMVHGEAGGTEATIVGRLPSGLLSASVASCAAFLRDFPARFLDSCTGLCPLSLRLALAYKDLTLDREAAILKGEYAAFSSLAGPFSSALAGAVPVRRPAGSEENRKGRLRLAAGSGEWPGSRRVCGFPVGPGRGAAKAEDRVDPGN